MARWRLDVLLGAGSRCPKIQNKASAKARNRYNALLQVKEDSRVVSGRAEGGWNGGCFLVSCEHQSWLHPQKVR